MSGSAEQRIADLGLDMGRLYHAPAGRYQNTVMVGDVMHVAGHGPLVDGKPVFRGRVPSEVPEDDAREAARLAAANCLASIRKSLGSLDLVHSMVKVLGMVNAEPGFGDHPRIIDGASELLFDVFGERGSHARSAVGMSSLPFGIPVEIEMILRVSDVSP